MTRTITITTLSRPKLGGFITHEVRLPGWLRPIGTGSLEDARRVAAGYTPAAGETVGIVETTQAAAKAKVRAAL